MSFDPQVSINYYLRQKIPQLFICNSATQISQGIVSPQFELPNDFLVVGHLNTEDRDAPLLSLSWD